MPELPEVETIRRGLLTGDASTPSLLQQRVTAVSILWEKTIASPSPREFTERISGKSIHGVERRGKFLLIQLEDSSLIFHLRMSGDLSMHFIPREEAPQPAAHDRLVLRFDSGWALVFNDTRKFGRAWLTPDPDSVIGSLGLEPLDPALTPENFHAMLRARSRQLKPLLMDQHFLAGLGNIYTDEALFCAGLHPLRLSSSLSEGEAGALLTSIRQVLLRGILEHGSSIDWVYRGGTFQNHFQVYQRGGENCFRCGALIHKTIVGQRGTHFCPVCQPEGT
ncbi:MAG: bifunctional DNA-formamidopyrimidine glycosylase/DNA-(apurinic or apyrimidinic site) lyase [Anaerolineaceae bacterium]